MPAPHTAPRLLRLPDVLETTGTKRSSLYRWIQAGTFPAPIRLGANTSVWPAAEIAVVLEARIAGADDAAARRLVAELHVKRQVRRSATAA